ncbi:trypsin-like peptidase domain-containing protein [Streptomyces sp. ISL-98]|uniref:S1C family serine protease n=1 Tax=Streptomyces sp. ISL-98 TaxID=2819192 RepID=UPI001BE8728E|nr:trypsin-like peptidase domain-containing protein [Streptomyces sp. ISL-98]MBT2510870.1 trypsin-like peptidase domain-containing protein [Streptomyces sp. ISL-98]
MTESPRRSGEYPEPEQQPSYGSGDEAWQRARYDADRAAQAYAAAYPPPPVYEPAHPGTPEARPGAGRKRAKRPVALLAAVAIVAAAIGGGAGAFARGLTDNGSGTGTGVTGTNVAQSSKGTVSGVAQAVSPSIVEISATSASGASTGSGVIITGDGEIITNNHVVSGASSVKVKLSDGKTYTADVVGTDPDKDLALIKLQGTSGLKAATLGSSEDVKVGDQVVAIGSPEGLTGTVTSGIVSALDRDVTVSKEEDQGQGQEGQGQQGGGQWPFEFGGQEFNGDTGSSKTTYKAIQTDASLNPGNSGGALINMNGEIIGINSAMYAPSGATGSTAGSVGLGFAIPVDTVKADLAKLRAGDSD